MAEQQRDQRSMGRLQRRWKVARRGAFNAATLLRKGRLSAPYQADFEVVSEHKNYTLRHYLPSEAPECAPLDAPLLLVPPLMVTSEIYDISPELSSITWLLSQGIDVWLVDFGAPEKVEGGLDRTLDDHILAVDASIDQVREITGKDVHLAGYSQGGMFVYQTAAYRRSEGLKSVITFGSPVDVRKIIPINMPGTVATRLMATGRKLVDRPLEELKSLPGFLTSTGFKLLSVRKEVEQIIQFFDLLPDRDALMKREPRRRFLNGEGFVAWPAPALVRFIDEVVVKNLMANGGLVINQKPISLTDITVPILCFVGTRDEIATPASVRAIHKAASQTTVHETQLKAGHFGIVVGSRALEYTWPTVAAWMRWQEQVGPEPTFGAIDTVEQPSQDDDDNPVNELYESATEWMEVLWGRVGDATQGISDTLETMRWQIPRLARLRRIRNESIVSAGRTLKEQAEAIPDSDFFLWGDRAWTYAEADARVNRFVHIFHQNGVKKGDHVGVLMDNHPDYLTAVVALNRMGAISVLFNAGLTGKSLAHAFEVAPIEAVVVDPQHAQEVAGMNGRIFRTGQTNQADEGIINIVQELDPNVIDPPEGLEVNTGIGSDTAFLMFTSGTTGLPRAARITNRRWALAALGTAAGLQLTDRDTVYCSLPIYHATGLLIGCGGALAGGARLALAPKFSTTNFWSDVHRYGATVVIYIGELCRYLVNAPPKPLERSHAVRMFAGNGMRADVWERVLQRFGRVQVMEFYGSTEGNVILANLTGKKIGSVGREMMPETVVELVRYDHDHDDFVRDEQGRLVPCADHEPGVMLAKIADQHPMSHFDGYVDATLTEKNIIHNPFGNEESWFYTGDMFRRDEDGDYWFVDRLGDTYRWKGENVSTEEVAYVIQGVPSVATCAVYGVRVPGREGRAGMVAIQVKDGMTFDPDVFAKTMVDDLFPAARPRFVRLVDALPVTSTLKLIKHHLKQDGADPRTIEDPLYVYDENKEQYLPLTPENYEQAIAAL